MQKFPVNTDLPDFDGIFAFGEGYKQVTPLQAIMCLFEATKDLSDFKEVHIPWELQLFAEFTYEANGFSKDLIIMDLDLIKMPYYPKDLTVTMFTGGKDSFSSYVKYHHLTDKDIAFFVRGLNPSYHNEYRNAEMLAEKLGIDIDILVTKLPKISNQPESPVKNALTYILATERYQCIPSFSFGHTTGIVIDNQNEIVETVENLDRYDYIVDTYMETGEFVHFAGVQASKVSGDKAEAGYKFGLFYELAYGFELKQSQGTYDEIEAYKIMESYGFGQQSSSCMTSAMWKDPQKKRLNNLYGVVIEGQHIIAGTLNGVSIFDLGSLEGVKLSMLEKVDYFGEYECGVCTKCTERYIVYANHFNYVYKKGFIENAKKSILRYMAKTKGTGTNEMGDYLKTVINFKIEEIPKEFKSPKNKLYIGDNYINIIKS